MTKILRSFLLISCVLLLLQPAVAESDRPYVDALLERVNAFRVENGVAPVESSSALMEAATMNSKDMAEHDYFGHTSPVPGHTKLRDRVEKAGYSWKVIGENIYRSPVEDPERYAAETMNNWINSPIHRENLLMREAEDIGIGIARFSNGETVVTLVLGAD